MSYFQQEFCFIYKELSLKRIVNESCHVIVKEKSDVVNQGKQ